MVLGSILLVDIFYVTIFGHMLRINCRPRQVIEGQIQGGIEVTGRRGRRRRNLLDDRNERRGYSHLKDAVPDRTVLNTRFGRGFGPVGDRLLNE
jgi:hypothetical protein